ncbi:hypothetical protein [Roseateles asaccharophilus]|uniref:Uncharacterized protein n=1 Tax=Roseateles asaccharophilus TaxID=582607 RepID=A0ABU2AF03_9BURK|nr:hypothetical protein [Roseateles asaccharophilus]MDR7334563.1 hypothetical protein [Roseateles asaccharophilus]
MSLTRESVGSRSGKSFNGDDGSHAFAKPDRVDTLSWLKALVAAAILVPLLMYAGAVWYLREQAFANAALRIERAARVSEERALKVFETDLAMLTRTLDLLGDDSIETLLAKEQALHQQLNGLMKSTNSSTVLLGCRRNV